MTGMTKSMACSRRPRASLACRTREEAQRQYTAIEVAWSKQRLLGTHYKVHSALLNFILEPNDEYAKA